MSAGEIVGVELRVMDIGMYQPAGSKIYLYLPLYASRLHESCVVLRLWCSNALAESCFATIEQGDGIVVSRVGETYPDRHH